jgi:CRISPR-associated protein Csd1
MIRELSDLGKNLRRGKGDGEWVHDALKPEPISMELVISQDGSFQKFNPVADRKLMPAEAITAKKGKARLLLDKPEEVLCYGGVASAKKHQLFLTKLADYQELEELVPVLAFYHDNKSNGLDAALKEYESKAATEDKKKKKQLIGNIGFRVQTEPLRIHEKPEVLRAVITRYELQQKVQLLNSAKQCSVCGENSYPVEDIPHGMIQKVPEGKPGGRAALVSYNETAFESYGLAGNENSSICSNCARTYVEGLNWLLSEGKEITIKNKKGKEKKYFRYTNRRKFGSDTAMVFWTRNNQALPELDQLEAPNDDDVARMIDSLATGTERDSRYLDPERFYSCSLSGAAARIAVRDWIETSLGDFRRAIAFWFKDVAIARYDKDLKEIVQQYTPLYQLARGCQRQRRKVDGRLEYDTDDTAIARVAATLWKAALQSVPIPLWVLTKVLQRCRLDVTTERAALIKLILNRKSKGGGFMVTKNLVQGDRPVAYVCGQIFAKLESIQYAALGERNAGIREKYFTYAMTCPAAAFGRLFNLNAKHFTKLKSKKPGLAVSLDKELQALCKDVDVLSFPSVFRLEEQGQFAIGYYHQKQEQFAKSK